MNDIVLGLYQRQFTTMQIVLYTVLALGLCQGALDNKGKQFMLGFMDNLAFPTDMSLEIFVTTEDKRPTTVHVRGPMANTTDRIDQTFTISKGQVHLVNISKDYRLHATELSSKGIEVTADHQVMVYGINRERLSNDGYLALPTDAIGHEYYAVCYAPASHYTLVLIIASSDDTYVSVRLPNNPDVMVNFSGSSYFGGDWMNITLDKFGTLELNSVGDLTGTYITADKPVSVHSGNQKTKVGIGALGGSRDHLVEQLLPVRSWGKHFAIIPLPERQTGEEYRVVASEKNTHFTVTGIQGGQKFSRSMTISEPGEFLELHYPPNTYANVTSDKPIQIIQFADTHASNGEIADPAMLTIVPVEQYAADYTFTTPKYSRGNYSNFFMFVIDKSQQGGLMIDGHPMTHAHYMDIPDSNLVAGWLAISPGTHTVSHGSTDVVFGGYLFGSAEYESYGFPVGLLLEPINNKCKPKAMTPGDKIDNDCDGEVDEEVCNKMDDDEDGKVDEDCNSEMGGIIG